MHRRPRGRRRVAEGVHPLAGADHAQRRRVRVHAPVRRPRRGRHELRVGHGAHGGDVQVRLHRLAVIQRQRRGRGDGVRARRGGLDRGHARVVHDAHADFREVGLGGLRDGGPQVRQETRAAADEGDAHFWVRRGRAEPAGAPVQVLAELAGYLDAGGAAARDDDVLGLGECLAERGPAGLERRLVAGEAEEGRGRRRASGDDQGVVADFHLGCCAAVISGLGGADRDGAVLGIQGCRRALVEDEAACCVL